MAGPTTAERGARTASPSGPPSRPGRPGARLRLPGRRTLVLLVAVIVLLGAGGTWVLYGSSWLRADRVKVSGTAQLTEDQVREAADVPLDTPMAAVDTGAIERRLRSRLPRIAQVTVSRSWPHTISLKVTERHAEAIVEQDGKFVQVDGSGVRFATLGSAPKGVPLLEMDVNGSASSRRFGTTRLRREAVGVIGHLPAAVRKDTRTVLVRSYDSITLELTGDRTVMWGSGERSAEKATVLTALMKAESGAEHFDVSAPSAPAVSGS